MERGSSRKKVVLERLYTGEKLDYVVLEHYEENGPNALVIGMGVIMCKTFLSSKKKVNRVACIIEDKIRLKGM